VDGFAATAHFDDGERPTVRYDLSEVFEGQLESAQRTFTKENGHSLLIEDNLERSDNTASVTWQMMTTADVIPNENGAVLRQDGETLNLEILAPTDVRVSVVSLDPPPLEIDRQIEGLKRVEIRIPTWFFDGAEAEVRVRLSGSAP
jgi:hypothetical protein